MLDCLKEKCFAFFFFASVTWIERKVTSVSSPFFCYTTDCFLPVLKATFLEKVALCWVVVSTWFFISWIRYLEQDWKAVSNWVSQSLFQELAIWTQGSSQSLQVLKLRRATHERPFSTKYEKNLRRMVMWRKWKGLTETEARDFITLIRRRVKVSESGRAEPGKE